MDQVDKTESYRIVLTQSQKVVPRSSTAIPEPNYEKLTLKLGSSFWSIEDNFETIYNNFNLLSYFSESCGIKIISRFYSETKDGKIIRYPCDYFQFKKDGVDHPFAIIEKSRDTINKDKFPNSVSPLKISYAIVQCGSQSQAENCSRVGEEIKILCEILVTANTQLEPFISNTEILLHIKNKKQVQSKQRQLIVFNVEDKTGWIQENFKDRPIEAHHHRLSMLRKPGLDQIEYFYRQSENQRSKVQKLQNVSLALQGGGCKGVLYIGAYKAIQKMLQEKGGVLSSVIGSSAGGILGLAICCGMKPEEVIVICQEKLSKITEDQTYKTVAEDESKIMEKTFRDVFKFLEDFNIFDDDIQKIFKDFLSDPAAQAQILNLILEATNQEVHKLFLDSGRKDKLNLVGLLKASLMTGNKIGEIATDCITSLIKKQKTRLGASQPEILANLKTDEDIAALAKNITMSQLYSLTQIQFTCTAVDIDNHILRFFNQKTTPHLPVCKAVQMTGSFPVAFEAQRWQRNWGKYYVHYDSIRREVDITGHRFTDGGTLANFPIKYLDNQDMRPMYFSHAKTANTNIYGIGLVTDIKPDPNKPKRISVIAGRIIKIFQSKVNKIWAVFNSITTALNPFSSPTKKTIAVTPNMFDLISKIPLIQFILELLKTYCKTKDNLIEQCFSHLSYETAADDSYNQQIIQRPNFMQILEKVRKLSTRVNQVLGSMRSEDDSFQRSQRLFIQNLKFIQSGSNAQICNEEILVKVSQITQNLLQAFFHSLFSNIKTQQQKQKTMKQFSSIVNEELRIKSSAESVVIQLIKICQNVNRETIFVLCAMQKDFIKLKSICSALNKFYDQQRKDSSQLIKSTLTQIGRRQKKYRSQFANHLRQQSERPVLDNQNHVIYFYQKISNSAVVTPLPILKQLASEIKQCQIPHFFIQFQSLMHRNAIVSYTLNQISRYYNNKSAIANYNQNVECENGFCYPTVQPDGIHIVLEAEALSQLFFYNYYAVVKEGILEYNHKLEEIEKVRKTIKKRAPLKVTTMTATGYQSLAIFLCASDLPQSRVEQEIWKLRDLINLDRISVQKRFNGSDWAKLTPVLLRQAQQLAVKNQKNIFALLQNDISANRKEYNQKFSKLKRSIEDRTKQVKVSDDQIMIAVQSSLSYLTNILMELEASDFKDANTFIEKVTLNIKPEMAYDRIREHSKSLVELFQFFFGKYKDLIQYLAGNSFFVIDNVSKMLRPEQRLLAWKGIMLCEVISGERIKVLVKKVLGELHLKQDTTLREFYNCSRQKIQLNFSVVEESVVSIFNYRTRPNMPMWAVLLAASSTPDFFAPLLDRPSWKNKIDQNFQIRAIKSYFSEQTKPYKFLSSSESLTKMPVDLLKNNQFQAKITNLKKQIFLVFSFGQVDIPNINRFKKLEITNLTQSDVLKKFVSFVGVAVEGITGWSPDTKQKSNIAGMKMAVSIPAVQSKKKMISLYIQSHDNLITQLYKRQLIQVPIRLNTLDFHLMTIKQNGKDKLSDLCQDSIMQAYFIVRQKIENKYSSLQMQKLSSRLNQKIIQFNMHSKQSGPPLVQIGTQLFIRPQDEQYYQRLFYFRVESTKLDPVYQKQLQNLNLQKVSDNIKLSNVLKIRFLSMLNPSNELYQQYFVYYRKSETDLTKSNTASYNKIKNESIYVNQLNYDKVYIKVQFSSSKELQIKCNYYELDLTKLYEANLIINSQGMAEKDKQSRSKYRFGYNYPLQFDTFYSPRNRREVLTAVNYEEDYMNRGHKLSAPAIGIISDIQGTIYASVACQKCVVPYCLIRKGSKLQPMNRQPGNQSPTQATSATSQTQLQCPRCSTASLLSSHYKINHNQNKNAIQCILGHELNRLKNKSEKGQGQVRFIVCDLCGKGGLNVQEYWKDPKCQVIVCESCKIQALH